MSTPIDNSSVPIIGIRGWEVSNDSILISPGQRTLWRETEMVADHMPTLDNEDGVYAFSLEVIQNFELNKLCIGLWGRLSLQPLSVIGLVLLNGEVIEHADGTFRAEKVKVSKLLVRSWSMNQGDERTCGKKLWDLKLYPKKLGIQLAEQLEKRYRVPVIVLDIYRYYNLTRHQLDSLPSIIRNEIIYNRSALEIDMIRAMKSEAAACLSALLAEDKEGSAKLMKLWNNYGLRAGGR